MFSPRAATRLGVNPNSKIRLPMAQSASTSTTSAVPTSVSWIQSMRPGGAIASRAETE